MLILNRPVLFLDGIDKIHNDDFKDFENFPIEQKFKNEFAFFRKRN